MQEFRTAAAMCEDILFLRFTPGSTCWHELFAPYAAAAAGPCLDKAEAFLRKWSATRPNADRWAACPHAGQAADAGLGLSSSPWSEAPRNAPNSDEWSIARTVTRQEGLDNVDSNTFAGTCCRIVTGAKHKATLGALAWLLAGPAPLGCRLCC